MQKVLLIVLTILLVIVIFSLQNAVYVNVRLFLWRFTISLPVLILLSLTIGAYLSFMFSIPGRSKKNRKIENLEKKIDEMRKEINDKKFSQKVEVKKNDV